MPAATPPDRRPLLLAGGAALAAYLALVARFDFVTDDAYISFRYSRNLAEGLGPVFNVGERVEGYSNFLWVVWLALFERLGLDVTVAARGSALACGIAALGLVARLMERRGVAPLAAGGALLVLATFPPWAMWTSGGLETVPFALALLTTFALLDGPPSRGRAVAAGCAGLAATLLRADGALWLAAVGAAAALGWRERRGERLRLALLSAGIVAAGVAAHVAWRVGYYGDWLPNTARIKAGSSALRLERGWKYLASHALELPALVLLPLAGLATLGRPHPRLALQAGVVLLFAALYTLQVGGDFMAMGRFLAPASPFLALLAAVVLERLLAARRGIPLAAAAVGLLVALALLASFGRMPIPDGWRQRLHFRWNDPRAVSEHAMWRGMRERAQQWALVGRALARVERPGDSIVLPNLGAVGYHTRLAFHDPFGLIDREVALQAGPPRRASAGHDKQVGAEFFLPRRPTYLGAWLAPAGAPEQAGVGIDLQSGGGRLLDVERHPLPAGEGFPPDTELRLLRFRWDR